MGLFPYILLFLQISSLSFFLSLFSFWDTNNANAYLVLSPRFLKPSSFLKTHFFFSFCCLVWLITTTLSSWLLICSSISSSLLLIFFSFYSIVYFIVFSSSVCFFFIFSNSIGILTVFIHSSTKFLEQLYHHFLEFMLDRLLVSILFSSFSEVMSCSFVWDLFLYLLTLPSSLVYICVSGRSAVSPDLREAVLCGRCPTGPRGALLSSTELDALVVLPAWAECPAVQADCCGCSRGQSWL